ncbi:MAG: STAS domain-containing protein [Solobacterium sp.]|nr:STAS domain-containing protein [Solobacterium sp.]
MDNQELREIVNPVFNTAKSCIQLNAASGEQDSIKLLDALGFEAFGSQLTRKRIPQVLLNQVKKLFPAYMILVEGRFQTMNRLVDSRKDSYVVDLPCGYTSRGIRMDRQGRSYVGLDLPAVIEEIRPAVQSIIGEKETITYNEADATNLSSLESAIPDHCKNLLITTEGLLMYFNQPELDEVFRNIHQLLEKHGGSWVISDRAYAEHDKDIAAAALNHNAVLTTLYNAITNKVAGSTADVKFDDNIFFDQDRDKVKDYVKKMGFELNEVCMGDYLPEHLGAVEDNPKAEEEVRKAFQKMFFWELSVAEGERGRKTFESKEKSFAVNAELENHILKLKLSGRLDTLTAPNLLAIYNEIVESEKIEGIEIDLEELEYVSSAGLRVFLIMYKALKNKKHFYLNHMNEVIKDILATTGFDSAFGLDLK